MLALQGRAVPTMGTVTARSSLRRGAHIAPAQQISGHRPFTGRLPRRRAVLVAAEKDDNVNGKKKDQADQLVKGTGFITHMFHRT